MLAGGGDGLGLGLYEGAVGEGQSGESLGSQAGGLSGSDGRGSCDGQSLLEGILVILGLNGGVHSSPR